MKKEQLISIIAQKLKDYDYEILTKNTDATYEMVAEEIVNEIINLGLQEKKEKEIKKIDSFIDTLPGRCITRAETIEILKNK